MASWQKLTVTFVFRFFNIFLHRTFLFNHPQSPIFRLFSPPTGLYKIMHLLQSYNSSVVPHNLWASCKTTDGINWPTNIKAGTKNDFLSKWIVENSVVRKENFTNEFCKITEKSIIWGLVRLIRLIQKLPKKLQRAFMIRFKSLK